MTRRLAHSAAAIALLAALAGASGAAAQAAPTNGPYRVIHRTVIGGEGGWDYIRTGGPGSRLYVSRGTHVMVVDLGRDTLAGDVSPTPGVHGIALVPELGRGFTSNGRDSTVTIFDLRTLAVRGTVKVTGRGPDAILYDAPSRRVFTFNGGSGNATAIDAARGTVAGTVALSGAPEAAVSDGLGHVWVNIEDRNAIEEFDARTLRSLGHWPLAGCEEPSGLAFDARHHRLFSVCSNGVMAVTNADTHRTVATVPIGRGADGAAFDPAAGMAFSSNGADGTMTVVHEDTPDRYTVVQTLATQRGARTIAFDPATHRVYTVTAELGTAPAPTSENPRPRRPVVPGTFVVLTIGRAGR
jgi:DNA-binding beta-propeller fold protein YncE